MQHTFMIDLGTMRKFGIVISWPIAFNQIPAVFAAETDIFGFVLRRRLGMLSVRQELEIVCYIIHRSHRWRQTRVVFIRDLKASFSFPLRLVAHFVSGLSLLCCSCRGFWILRGLVFPGNNNTSK